MDITQTITHLSLCSGYEGIGLGLRRVLPNLREIAYVEREGFPCTNLVAKMEAECLDAAPVFTDVKTFPYTRFRHKVDILSGGFPCQPFSAAGKRKATEDPRHLFPFIANGIRDCKPRIVFLENVEGIISAKTADGESVLKYVLGRLEELGYRATAGIFSASEVGAPHQRKRVFILGYSNRGGRSPSEQPRGSSEKTSGRQGDIEPTSGIKELANSKNLGCGGRKNRDGDDGARLQEQEAQEQSNLRSETAGCSRDSRGELADTNHSRGYEDRQSTELWSSGTEQSPIHRWPARPGEAQQEWEEPRVVGDTESQQGSSDNHGGESGATGESGQVQSGGGCSRTLRQGDRETQPKLGRATNGASSRVDRLRLLGNGCVPQTVEKAFVTLLQRLV